MFFCEKMNLALQNQVHTTKTLVLALEKNNMFSLVPLRKLCFDRYQKKKAHPTRPHIDASTSSTLCD